MKPIFKVLADKVDITARVHQRLNPVLNRIPARLNWMTGMV
jgi:hypothetical protein